MNEASPAPSRVVSVDALRGFTMLWIVGGGGLAKAMHAFGENPLATLLATQFEHARWEGCHFEDLIFPTFVFIAGVSLVFSLTRTLAAESRAAAAVRILKRAAILFALGVIYNGGWANGFENIRWLGVLQRIALSYLGASLLFLYLKPRGLVVALITILVGYWTLLTFVPVPGIGPGHFAEQQNLSDYLDSRYLPGRKYNGDHDPEGLLSTLPAIGSCLFGVLTGLFLNSGYPPTKKLRAFLLGGLLLIGAGCAWDAAGFPIIKKIWTSSYVLLAAGWSTLFLGLFYGLIDLVGIRRWATPFIWIGMNPITLYFIANLVDISKLSLRVTGGDVHSFLNRVIHPGTGELFTAITGMTISILIARFLYHRGIFLRV